MQTSTTVNVNCKKSLFNFLLFLFCSFSAIASGQTNFRTLTGKVSVSYSKATLLQIIADIDNQSVYNFTYNQNALSQVTISNFVQKNQLLSKVLAELQLKTPLEYAVNGNNIAVLITEKGSTIVPKKQENGKITGRVLDDKGETLPGANIKILELNKSLQSSSDGSYSLSLPKGTYTIEASYISFQTQRITGVVVANGKNTPLDIAMKAAKNELSEVLVTSSYRAASVEGLYARQKNNASITDGITADQISRTSDNNTAQVLRRVSGLQVTDNKFVVIRGLSERYNNVLLNNGQLPSTEPNRKNFSFDIVPSALLDNIEVYKTATPDLPGEFSGGTVKINTKDIPDENFTQLTIGSGFNSESTGKDFVSGKRAQGDYFGFDTYRGLPADFKGGEYVDLWNKWNLNKSPENLRAVANMGSKIPSNWALYNTTAKPTQNYQFQIGRAYQLKNNDRFGFVGALTYRNEQNQFGYDYYRSTLGLDYTGNEYNFTTAWGAIANLSYSFGQNKISLKNLYNRRLEDQTADFTGTGSEGPVSNDISQFTINGLYQSRLEGEHQLSKNGIQLNWNADLTDLKRDQPNSRTVYRAKQTENQIAYQLDYRRPNQGLGSVYFSNLTERRYSWGTDLKIPFKLLKQNQLFKLGYLGSYRKATFNEDVYRYLSGNWPEALGADGLYGIPVYEALSQEMIAKGAIVYGPRIVSRTSGNGGGSDQDGAASGYGAYQRLNAFYAMVDFKPLEKLRIIGGLRTEINNQNVQSQVAVLENGVVRNVDSLNRVKKTDFLPSVNAVYTLTKKLNIRLAYYKTVARPDFRELSRFQYYDFRENLFISGDSLKTTNIHNFDFRVELYNKPGQIISVGLFYKRFLNPIETQFSFSTSAAAEINYANLLSAENKGIELDFRQSFALISPGSKLLSQLYLSGNFTYIDAKVKFKGDATRLDGETRERPLIGQSPYIVNGGLLYTGDKFGFNLVYNRYGKRIVTGGFEARYDDYENPRDVLDLQLSYKLLKKKGEFRLNASDLLNQPFIIYANQDLPNGAQSSVETDPKGTSYNPDFDYVRNRSVRGRTFTLSFAYNF